MTKVTDALYELIEVGDLIEYHWCNRIVKGLVLSKDGDGHLSCGEEKPNNKINIPNAVWKANVICIVQKQAIDGKMYLKYGV